MMERKLLLGLAVAVLVFSLACTCSEEWCKQTYKLEKIEEKGDDPPVRSDPNPVIDLDPDPTGTIGWTKADDPSRRVDLKAGGSIFDRTDRDRYCRLREDFFEFGALEMTDVDGAVIADVEKVRLVSVTKNRNDPVIHVVIMKDPITGKLNWAAARTIGSDVTVCPLLPTPVAPGEDNLIPEEFTNLAVTSMKAVFKDKQGARLTIRL